MAHGDIIFPCDQDDHWRMDKVEYMSRIMESHSEIDVPVGRYSLWTSENIIHTQTMHGSFSLWNTFREIIDRLSNFKNYRVETEKLIKKPFNSKFLSLEPACCLCVRKTFSDSLKQYWIPEYGHDAYLTYYSKLKDSFYYLDKVVINWRYHEGSASRPKRRQRSIRISELDRNA